MRFRKKKKKRSTIFLVVVALAVVLIVSNYVTMQLLYMQQPQQQAEPIPGMPGMPVLPPTLEGYEMVEIDTSPGIVRLKSNCTAIEMLTSEQQSSSIQDGIDGKLSFRPSTHDTTADILETYLIDPVYVRVDKLEAGTYFSKLVLESDDRALILDARPTDAIAIAVRFGSPVYVKKVLLETYGVGIC